MNKRGFTLIEILVVVLIVGLLIGISVPRLETSRHNNNIDSVEADLRVFSLDMNNYNLDFSGPFIKNCDDTTLVSDLQYQNEAKQLVDNLNEYTAFQLDIDTMVATRTPAVGVDPGKCKVVVNTKLRQDAWGSDYVLMIDARMGNTIVASPGPNKIISTATYSSNNFDDDILVIIKRK